jgi:hypothetical protein
MNILSDFPRKVRTIEHCWIPMSDGTRLAARIWLPEDAEQDPVPALLEYLPYRKNDGTVVRDALRHPYFAGHGYASVRVDMRGSGDSDGILTDEYLSLEQQDGLEVLTWLASQQWCTGKVGIFGKSWGGFNGLQIASHQPPELGGIITMCSTDDRYADDVHYKGGCVLAEKMVYWSSTMLAYSARPPDPKVVGDRWREMWMERLETSRPGVDIWLRHQRRDDYWKQGSVCEDFSKVTCPVYAVGGWADGYVDAVFRLLAGLSCPKKGLIGPWAHNFPEEGTPGRPVGFLQESLRWWDWCLKGESTGVIDGSVMTAWIHDGKFFLRDREDYPGFWVNSAGVTPTGCVVESGTQSFTLSESGVLGSQPTNGSVVLASGDSDIGARMGNWCTYGDPVDFSEDQNIDDARCLTFETEPLGDPITLLGIPTVSLSVDSDEPEAIVAARLCDVAPDGSSSLVSWGILNLTRRNGMEEHDVLVPGTPTQVQLPMKSVGYRISARHRWRLSLSTSCWPFAWPVAGSPSLSLDLAQAMLELPVMAPEADTDLHPFESPETPPPLERVLVRPSAKDRVLSEQDGATVIRCSSDSGRFKLADGLEYEEKAVDTYRIDPASPLTAEASSERWVGIGRPCWDVDIEAEGRMWCDATHFHIENHLLAREGDEVVFDRTWRESISRDTV